LLVRGESSDGAFTLTKGPWPLPKKVTPAVVQPAVAASTNAHGVLVRAGRTLLEINVVIALLGALGYAAYWSTLRLRKGAPWKKH
jgi:hypothetical protein